VADTTRIKSPGTALILTGGGARAAYQVGFLLAVAKLSTNRRHNPFPILCGTSAGAINAAGIACLADNFGKAISILAGVWLVNWQSALWVALNNAGKA